MDRTGVEVLDDGVTWSALLRWIRGWDEHAGYDLGLWALQRARDRGHAAVGRDARFRREGYQYW